LLAIHWEVVLEAGLAFVARCLLRNVLKIRHMLKYQQTKGFTQYSMLNFQHFCGIDFELRNISSTTTRRGGRRRDYDGPSAWQIDKAESSLFF